MAPENRLYVGCAVWGHKPWRGDFLPEKTTARRMLDEYAARLPAVEINATFYGIPAPETCARWASQVPEEFKFCPKVPRSITHERDLARPGPDLDRFLAAIEPLSAHLGPVLLQLGPDFGPRRRGELERFVERWPSDRYELSVEVRHPDWWRAPHDADLSALLYGQSAARVILDARSIYDVRRPEDVVQERKKPDLPLAPELTSKTGVVRFVAHPDAQIALPYLNAWVERAVAWLQAGITLYFFAHCPDEDQTPGICRAFWDAVSERVDVGALPWDSAPQAPEQGSLLRS